MKERLLRFRSFWIFPLLTSALLSLTYRGQPASLPWCFAAGVALWTLLEYFFHRFLLHSPYPRGKAHAVVNGSHLGHHAAPRDGRQILVHPTLALLISAVVYAALVLVTRNPFYSSGAMSGIWAGFLYYESVHYRVHLSLKNSALLQLQRRAHFYHHFSNSSRCFGVTSPLWDYVFGTARRFTAG